MKIKTAEFITSNTDYKKCPNIIMHEYAFIGRSNVGKSSLINMLTGNSKLAKISSTPGKTQLINHFLINNQWYLVDLPGYGYAKISKTQREKWKKMINNYILFRTNLICLFVLVDSRISPQKNDLEFIEWLGNSKIPFVLVFTKIDKLTDSSLKKTIDNYKSELLKKWDILPEIFLTSARNGDGKKELLMYIDNLNSNININN